MQLKDPPEWSCVQCTLLNQVASTRCVACSHPRGPQQGGTAWVSAACVAPLIACAGDEKELCQRHFAEQERLVQAAIANLQAVDNSLGLRRGGWRGVERRTRASVGLRPLDTNLRCSSLATL